MYKKLIYLFILIFIINTNSFGQKSLLVEGQVIEKTSSIPMEYCTISLYNQSDSSLVTGTISNKNGTFNISVVKPSTYYIKISYIGFETFITKDIKLNAENPKYSLKKISLIADSKTINNVEIVGEKSTIRYEMDKKVISVGKDIAASNGSAVDVLENVASVDVDVQGNVKLRGSSNFMVLINGKPSVLSGKEALQQIPASNIKNIEIITNPSAKYEAGNTGGIINIILKEEKRSGTSGLFKVMIGTFDNNSAGVSIKHNVKKFGFSFSASTYNNHYPSNSIDSLRTSFSEVNIKKSDIIKSFKFPGHSLKYGITYKLLKDHSLNLDFTIGKWGMTVSKDENVHEINETLDKESFYINENFQDRNAKYYGPSLSYQGTFKNKSNLSVYVGAMQRDFKEKVYDTKFDLDNNILFKNKSTEIGLRNSFTSKIDYTLPIKEGSLEFGVKANLSSNKERTKEYIFDLSKKVYSLSLFNNKNINYSQKVYGLYANYSGVLKKFNYSLGFRAEYDDRNIEMVEDFENVSYYKWHYFPSAALSYKIKEQSKIYLNYSRRIHRPRSYMLEPIPILTGAKTYFKGNTNLKPELVNSFELGWSNTFKEKTTLSLEAFYKYNEDIYDWISFEYKDNSIIMIPTNYGTSQDLGLEANLNLKPLKWWSIDISATGMQRTTKGSINNINMDHQEFNWKSRFNNYFTVTKTTKLQFTGSYKSPNTRSTYSLSEELTFGLGLKQSFLKKALNLTLNISNAFNTETSNWESSYKDYYNQSKSVKLWPFINVGLNYKINNYRASHRKTERGQGDF